MANVIASPNVAGSATEAQEEVGTQVAVQIKDYLADGLIRNAVNLPALSADQYRRVRPYLALAERLGSLVSPAVAARPAWRAGRAARGGSPPAHVRGVFLRASGLGVPKGACKPRVLCAGAGGGGGRSKRPRRWSRPAKTGAG